MKDDLLKGFVQEVIELDDDYEGEVCAVLVSPKEKIETKKAVLYIHGFADYFFNPLLADVYSNAEYNFYALDLRKYGRALMPHQHKNFCKDMSEYFEEIDKAVSTIRERDNHRVVILNGHSNGGLITTLYAHDRRGRHTIDGLILTSPWFDINEHWFLKHVVAKIIYSIGKIAPLVPSPRGIDPNYPRAIHKDYAIKEKKEAGIYEEGLWEFNIHLKGISHFPVYSGFLRAVRNGHRRVQKGLELNCPILLLHSDKKGERSKKIKSYYFTSDCVLDPADMAKQVSNLGTNVTESIIPNGIHDLSLSPKPVRDEYFARVTKWLKERF